MSEEFACRSYSRLQNYFRDLVWNQLGNLRYGRLVFIEGTQSRAFGDPGYSSLIATITVRDPRFYRYVVFGGSLGAADAYIRGFWVCNNLVDLIRIFCSNADVLDRIERGAGATLPRTMTWGTISFRSSWMRLWPTPVHFFRIAIALCTRLRLPSLTAFARNSTCARRITSWKSAPAGVDLLFTRHPNTGAR